MIVAVVGPSGAGKDTLIAHAKHLRPDLHLVRRVITRPSDAGGENFEGVSLAEFAARKARCEFALDWQAHGLHYALPRTELAGTALSLFNGSRAALPAALRLFPALKVILVTAPEAVLAARLSARGRESAGDVNDRLARADFAMPPGIPYVTVQNDGHLNRSIARFMAALHDDDPFPPGGADRASDSDGARANLLQDPRP
ncbi:MAG: phosphonate metabolism protein/1,5-bisphosphokinase (PRPP-forming) PhnN [Gemmobacter sp.]